MARRKRRAHAWSARTWPSSIELFRACGAHTYTVDVHRSSPLNPVTAHRVRGSPNSQECLVHPCPAQGHQAFIRLRHHHQDSHEDLSLTNINGTDVQPPACRGLRFSCKVTYERFFRTQTPRPNSSLPNRVMFACCGRWGRTHGTDRTYTNPTPTNRGRTGRQRPPAAVW